MTSIDDKIDELELAMQDYEPVDCPLTHTFSPGLYLRTIVMPAGTLITSMIHRTEHQFVVSAGVAMVRVNDEEWQRIEAPYVGKTYPRTRRVLYIEQTCVWTTVHATEVQPMDQSKEAIEQAVIKIEEIILEPHVNNLLGGMIKNNIIQEFIN